jgi:hypothetical protein
MDSENEATYLQDLRKYWRFDKPIIILEFGCCTFEGADKAGGMGWEAVDYTNPCRKADRKLTTPPKRAFPAKVAGMACSVSSDRSCTSLRSSLG